jgi:hypothetical protein
MQFEAPAVISALHSVDTDLVPIEEHASCAAFRHAPETLQSVEVEDDVEKVWHVDRFLSRTDVLNQRRTPTVNASMGSVAEDYSPCQWPNYDFIEIRLHYIQF